MRSRPMGRTPPTDAGVAQGKIGTAFWQHLRVLHAETAAFYSSRFRLARDILQLVMSEGIGHAHNDTCH